MSQIEFPYGYAGDVAVSAGTVWMAWATCETDELSLFSEVNRAWPLRPGLDATTWREYPPATMAVYVSRLSPAGEPAAPQRLAAGRSYIQGPILAATDGQEPWVVWCEQRAGGYALVAWRHGRQHTVATSPRPLLQPAAAADRAGRLCVAWQAWARPDTPTFALYARWLAADGTLVGVPGDAAADLISPPDASSASSDWTPALAALPDGSVWCAWERWQGGASHILLRRAPAPGHWDEPLAASTAVGLDLEPSLAVDPDGLLWVAWSRSTPGAALTTASPVRGRSTCRWWSHTRAAGHCPPATTRPEPCPCPSRRCKWARRSGRSSSSSCRWPRGSWPASRACGCSTAACMSGVTVFSAGT